MPQEIFPSRSCVSVSLSCIIIIVTFPVKSNRSIHHYGCVALYSDINLQRGRFWASSLASCSSRSREDRSPWIVFIQIVRGHPGGPVQLLWGGSKMTWLASAFSSILTRCPKKDETFVMDESGGWLVIWQTSVFLTKSCQRMPRILHRHHWSSASFRSRSALLIAQHSDL